MRIIAKAKDTFLYANAVDVDHFNDTTLTVGSQGGVYSEGGIHYDDPLWTTNGARAYYPPRSSPCVQAGSIYSALKPLYDLDGREFNYKHGVSAGCYEQPKLGMMILLR